MLKPRGWLKLCFVVLMGFKPLGGQSPDSGFRGTEVDNLVIARKLEIERATGYGGARIVASQSHRADRFAVARDSETVTVLRIFSLPSGRLLQKINVDGEMYAIAWSPDDSRIFFSGTSTDGTRCSVIELATGLRKGLPGICAPNGYWVDDSTLITPDNGQYSDRPTPIECNLYAMTCRPWSRDWSGSVAKPFFSRLAVVSSVHELLFPYSGDPATYGLFAVSLRDSSYRDLGASAEANGPAAVIQLADPHLLIVPTRKATWLFELRTAPAGPKGFVVGVNSVSDTVALAPISQRLRAGAVVGGWVCPALRNPLNNRVVGVGCDRSTKAAVQLMQIRSGALEFRVRESFAPIVDGDAVLISDDGRRPGTGSPWAVLTSQTFRSPEIVLAWERDLASTRTVSAPEGSAVSSSSDAGVVRARRSIDQLSASPPNEWVRWAARNWSSDRQLFRATTVDMPGTPQEVWEYLRQLFATSKFDVKDGDSTGLFLVTSHQDLLGVKRMLYYVTLSADSPRAKRTRVALELFYFVGGKADANGAKVLQQDLVDILPKARP